jgi:NitT/TauT family transport system ATP-binding protein
LQEIADALPDDNLEKILRTMIAWGRYARIMDYNPDSKTVFVPHDEENATK